MVALESMFHPPPDVDARVELDGVGWADYERLVAVRGEASVPRLTYLEGRLELMSPGRSHESDKKKLARLLEAYADHLGLALEGLGSWTVKREEVRRGIPPHLARHTFATALSLRRQSTQTAACRASRIPVQSRSRPPRLH